MDPGNLNIISTIISGGAMGVAAYCIYNISNLYKKEQVQESPRKVFLDAISKFKIFAYVMVFLALGVEVTKHYIGEDHKDRDRKISEIMEAVKDKADGSFYSVDEEGTPKKVVITIDEEDYILSKALPSDLKNKMMSGDSSMQIIYDADDGRYNVFNNSGVVKLGYLSFPFLKKKGLFNNLNDITFNNLSGIILKKDTFSNSTWTSQSSLDVNLFPFEIKVEDRSIGTIYSIFQKGESTPKFSSATNPGIIDSGNNKPIHLYKVEHNYFLIYLAQVDNTGYIDKHKTKKKKRKFSFTILRLEPDVK